jgi:predicted nucleic-acid-binding Zn-ribbon protein
MRLKDCPKCDTRNFVWVCSVVGHNPIKLSEPHWWCFKCGYEEFSISQQKEKSKDASNSS